MGVRIELQRLELDIPELKTVVHEIEKGGVVCGVENGPAQLDLYGTPELVGGKLLVKVNEYITVDAFGMAEYVVCPHCSVHELVYVALHGLENLAVRALDLLGRDLDIAVKLLGLRRKR